MKKILFIGCAILLGSIGAIAQEKRLQETAYTEIIIDRKQGEQYKVLPIGQNGVLCF